LQGNVTAAFAAVIQKGRFGVLFLIVFMRDEYQRAYILRHGVQSDWNDLIMVPASN